MKFCFLPEADNDLRQAIKYYEDCQNELGLDFLIEFDKAIRRIVEYPQAWQEISNNFRRCLLSRFPYGIIYSVEPDCILIVSVMNLHKHPNTWKNKKKN
jgi:plasmid stabilization system protein ParE